MNVVLIADAGPLITLAYADSLDVLFKPGWSVQLVDIVVHEVTIRLVRLSVKRYWLGCLFRSCVFRKSACWYFLNVLFAKT